MAAVATAADTLDPAIIELRRRLDMRLSELRSERTVVEYEWREISRLLLPERGRYLVQTSARRPRATSSAILDPTACKAHGRLASFLMAGITNPSLPWLKLGTKIDDVDQNDDVRSYFAECEKRLYRVFSAGSFYPSMHQAYEEIAGFGTAAIIAMPDFDQVMRFHALTIGEYMIGLDSKQDVNEIFREYELTTSQLVEQFGYDSVSPNVKAAFDRQNFAQRQIVCHAIQPNRDRKPGKLGWRNKPWQGIYFERAEATRILKGEGFDHKPFIAPRWHALAGDAYGIGPGHKALPDIRSLQAGVRQIREAADKLVNPPLQGDASFQNAYQGQMPGDVNWIPGLNTNQHAGMRPIFQVPPNISALAQELDGYRKALDNTFYNDMILAISQMEGVQPRNQMEISERRNEKMLMLGPMLERFYTEALAPIVRLTFSRMQAVGMLPPAPPQLHGLQVEPSFISVLAAAQKAVGTTGIEAVLRLAGSMAGVWPGVVQKVDADQVIEQYAEAMDAPNTIVVPQKMVDAARAQAKQEQDANMAAQRAEQLAGGAQTLSQTPVGGGQSALSAMLGRPGGAE